MLFVTTFNGNPRAHENRRTALPFRVNLDARNLRPVYVFFSATMTP